MELQSPIHSSHETSAPADDASMLARPKQRVLIETWGCQMNVADSEKMLKMLQDANYQMTTSDTDADLFILNTCHIREKATHKVLSRLGVLNQMKEKSPGLRIAVAGCVAQAEGKQLLKDAPSIDVLLGPGKIEALPSLLREREESGKQVFAIGFKEEHTDSKPKVEEKPTEPVPTVTGKNEVSRFVNIAQGCNNFCTFCVVPHTRGREDSRTADAVFSEVENLVRHGAREITLLGQNVNSYGSDFSEARANLNGETHFVRLLKQVAGIDGLDRLRFTTSNPHDFTTDLAQLFATEPKLGRYLHLPVQSGNDRILEKMRRKVTVAEYRERVSWLRSIDPEFALSTDLIVGFPGETDEEFEDTLKLVKEIQFSFSFCFKYSSRSHTPAARFKDQIPEGVKDERLARLLKLQDSITLAQNLTQLGRSSEILITYESKRDRGTFYGRTPEFRLVRVPSGRDIVGQILPVTIVSANKTALEATLI